MPRVGPKGAEDPARGRPRKGLGGGGRQRLPERLARDVGRERRHACLPITAARRCNRWKRSPGLSPAQGSAAREGRRVDLMDSSRRLRSPELLRRRFARPARPWRPPRGRGSVETGKWSSSDYRDNVDRRVGGNFGLSGSLGAQSITFTYCFKALFSFISFLTQFSCSVICTFLTITIQRHQV